MDRLETWLNKQEPRATVALDLYHQDCLENGEPPTDLRERIDRILALILVSARTGKGAYPYKVLFNRAYLASRSTEELSSDDVATAPQVARVAALEAAEKLLRSTRILLPSSQGKHVSKTSRLKTAMRAAMREVCRQYGVPVDRTEDPNGEDQTEFFDGGERAGGHRSAQARRYPMPLSRPPLSASDIERSSVTSEELMRYRSEYEKRQRGEAQLNFIALMTQPGFKYRSEDRERFIEVGKDAAALAVQDPFLVAAGRWARGDLAEGVATLLQSQRHEAAEFRAQTLIALAGSTEPAPEPSNLVLLEGRRRMTTAERRERNAQAQRESRARRKADEDLRNQDVATDTSQRVFGPDEQAG